MQGGIWIVRVAVIALSCVGCSAAPLDYPASPPAEVDLVTVTTMDLRPTVSIDAAVVASPQFVVLAPSAGVATGLTKTGAKVMAGEAVAQIDGVAVKSLVDGVVVEQLVVAEQTVPVNLPLLTIQYAGFGLEGTPTSWASSMLFQPVATARGQVTYGAGPFDCEAMVPVAGADTSQGGSAPWVCLLPKDQVAADGQSGIVVVVGDVATGVLAVPLTAVAGRVDSGQVTLVTGGTSQVVTVQLGRSDGTNIEVTDGLKAGDTILAIAPDLAAKGPS